MKIKVKNILTKSEMARFKSETDEFNVYFDVTTKYEQHEHIYESEVVMRIIFLNKDAEDNNDEFPYSNVLLDCEFSGNFEIANEDIDNDIDIEKVMRTNCSAMLYPFIRERIARITQESLYRKPYYLESINFIAVYSDWIKRISQQG